MMILDHWTVAYMFSAGSKCCQTLRVIIKVKFNYTSNRIDSKNKKKSIYYALSSALEII